MSKNNRRKRASTMPVKQTDAPQSAPSRAPNGLRVSPVVGDAWSDDMGHAPALPLTLAEVRKRYGPPKTLGGSDQVRMACDSQLEQSGVYTLLQHSFSMGQMPQAQFLGYGVLQQISQSGMIRACVETTADDMTRNWIELKREGEAENKSDEQSLLESAGLGQEEYERETVEMLAKITAEMERLKLQTVFHDAATLVGYMGGAMIFIDTGETDPEVLRQPLNLTEYSAELQKDHVLRFVPVDPINIFPGLYNSINPLREDYFKPKTWWVLGTEVHASRLIRLVANEVPVLLKPCYNFFGIAQAQLLWDYVMHFNSVRIASQRLLGKFSLTVMKTDMANILTQAGGTEDLDRRIALLVRNRSNDGVQVIDKEMEDILKLETPISGVTDVVRQSLEILAAMNRTPAVKLLGISPSGFNATGESDLRNYYDHILSQQEKIFRPALDIVLRVLQVHLFGKIDKSITFDFAALSEADQAATANTQKLKVDTMAVLLDRSVVSPEECRQALADDPDSGFANIDVDDVPEPQEDPETAMGGQGELDDVDKAGSVYDASKGNGGEVAAPFKDETSLLGLDTSRAWLFWQAEDAEFKEGDHPRDENGRFTKGKSSSSGPIDITDFLGEEIKGVKGKSAVKALLEKQGGHVKEAFYRKEIGSIDLFWGDDNCGLKHIIKRRTEDGQDVEGVLNNISSVIANGTVKRDYEHETDPNDKRWKITRGKHSVVVSKLVYNHKMTYVLTAFEEK